MKPAPSGPRAPWQEPWLRSILRCPADHSELDDVTVADAPALACRTIHRDAAGAPVTVAFLVRDGVPDLLLDDAVVIEQLPEPAQDPGRPT